MPYWKLFWMFLGIFLRGTKSQMRPNMKKQLVYRAVSHRYYIKNHSFVWKKFKKLRCDQTRIPYIYCEKKHIWRCVFSCISQKRALGFNVLSWPKIVSIEMRKHDQMFFFSRLKSNWNEIVLHFWTIVFIQVFVNPFARKCLKTHK